MAISYYLFSTPFKKLIERLWLMSLRRPWNFVLPITLTNPSDFFFFGFGQETKLIRRWHIANFHSQVKEFWRDYYELWIIIIWWTKEGFLPALFFLAMCQAVMKIFSAKTLVSILHFYPFLSLYWSYPVHCMASIWQQIL